MRVDAKTEKIKRIQNPKVPKAKIANIQPWLTPLSRFNRALVGASNNHSSVENLNEIN